MTGEKYDRIKNLKGHKFPKSPQGLDDKKSQGQINLAKNNNIISSARTLFQSANILPELIDKVQQEVQDGYTKNAIELLKILKEPEKQTVELEGQVQKIYVTKEEIKNVKDHIKEFIE